jgi:hypothetical protein
MKQLTWCKLYLHKIIQITQQTSGVGMWISGIETCNHKQGTDKNQKESMKFRNQNLKVQECEFSPRTHKETKFRNYFFGVQE